MIRPALVTLCLGAAGLAVAAAGFDGRNGVALADSAPADPTASTAGPAIEDGGVSPPVLALPSVALSGPLTCVLASAGEATVVWRHGRTTHGPVDETTSRLRVSGAGATSERLALGFSVAMTVPELRVGRYEAPPGPTALASVWVRPERADPGAGIEWSSDALPKLDGGAAAARLDVTSIAQTSRDSEREGDVIVETTRFVVHGSLQARVACRRSGASLRGICGTETLGGTF